MQQEEEPLFIPTLYEIDAAGATQACHDLVSMIPLDAKFILGRMILQLVNANRFKSAVMKRAIKEEKELGLVIVGSHYRVIEGNDYSIKSGDVDAALEALGGFKEKALFMHTHWNRSIPPFPCPQNDLSGWFALKTRNPLIDCRVAFPQFPVGDEVRSFRFIDIYREIYIEN